MELNEITGKLPKHLLQFVVDQPYQAYTPVDQAVWRYVMRQNYHHLRRVAHESYVQGLQLAGVEIDQIPTMYGMNRILKNIGWAAVAVDGFIPPGAFMEFTKYNVLVIAADIRTLEHIEYTPAPDIIHESAGHAPILAVPEFAAYLKHIGEVGCKAFSSYRDMELYEAIRHLSIIKEDPTTDEKDIKQAEKDIERIQGDMGAPSELALIRNLHWWTVEYGLIGTLDNFKLYGAGLLSSIGEGMSCLAPEVKKLPYTLEAQYCNYDITRPQPQLFVTPDFTHLNKVLDEFKKTMAWTTGGLEAVRKAIDSQQTGTIVYNSGLQVSGTFSQVIHEDGQPVFVETSGPSALATENVQLANYGKVRFPGGFSSPVGKLVDCRVNIEDMSESELLDHRIVKDSRAELNFERHVTVSGVLRNVLRGPAGRILLFDLEDAQVKRNGNVLRNASRYTVAVGASIISAFAGPADVEAFEPTAMVPREKMHKPTYNKRTLDLHELYRIVREARADSSLTAMLPETWSKLKDNFPGDWLLSLEILEILRDRDVYPELTDDIEGHLEVKRKIAPHMERLIGNGLKLLEKERV